MTELETASAVIESVSASSESILNFLYTILITWKVLGILFIAIVMYLKCAMVDKNIEEQKSRALFSLPGQLIVYLCGCMVSDIISIGSLDVRRIVILIALSFMSFGLLVSSYKVERKIEEQIKDISGKLKARQIFNFILAAFFYGVFIWLEVG